MLALRDRRKGGCYFVFDCFLNDWIGAEVEREMCLEIFKVLRFQIVPNWNRGL
jgi:hypothetical protein